MADRPKPQQLAEQITWQIHPKIDAWRKSRKFAGVIVVNLGFILGLGDYVPYAEANEVARYLDCEWAFNPMTRALYFIPRELLGEER